MSVATTARKQQFTLDGVTAAFTFTFRALTSAPSDIKCKKTASGVETDLTYTTQYTVAINSNGVGGTVTLVNPAAIGSGTLTVYRETTNKQESTYSDYNQFPASTVENDFDIRTLVSQEADEDLERSTKLPISVTGVTAELPVPVANKILGWNSGATGIENKDAITAAYLTQTEAARDAALVAQTAAETAETNAETAETNAETAETNAEAAQAAAEATLKVAIHAVTDDYLLALTDVDKLVDMNKASAVTLTVPLNSHIAIPTGSVIAIRQLGAGQVTISPTNGSVTIRKETGLKTTGQYALAALVKTGTDEWLATGALEA